MAKGIDLGKQVGPLPLGAWFVVVGAGVGFALYARGTGDGTVVDGGEDTSIPPGVGEGPAGFIPVGPVTPESDEPLVPVTNEEWLAIATAKLLAQGPGYDPVTVLNALTRYINGQTLDPRALAIVNAAISAAGVPPMPLAAVPTPTVPTVPPRVTPKKKARTISVYIRPGDTLYTIATRYYSKPSNKWKTILAANPKVLPAWYRPTWRISWRYRQRPIFVPNADQNI